MCQISEVVKMTDGTFVCCTSTSSEFKGAKVINFFDGVLKFTVNKFSLGKKTQCFRENPVAPLIKLEEYVPENFLQRGNKVVFG